MDDKDYDYVYLKIEKIINDNIEIFNVPNENTTNNSYYPDYLKSLLLKYESFFITFLNDLINKEIPTTDNKKNVILKEIKNFNKVITETIDKYFTGKPYDANKIFSDGIRDTFLEFLQIETEIPKGKTFFRARIGNEKQYSRKDLFHIEFENRHLVSTNRYSIPGVPALYLGDSSYVCWEEFNRPRFRELWFSRMQNTEPIKIIEILLVKDALKKINDENDYSRVKIIHLLKYLIYFPLTLSCTIKVKKNGGFKPEYIISQMLLEYVLKNEEIDGIKFPSTKISYEKVSNIDCYNYIFPVKTSKKEGICNKLEKLFNLTDPTSLEMLELLNNPAEPVTYLYSGQKNAEQTIELMKDEKLFYLNTSFGKIEHELKKKKLKKVL